MKPQPTFQVGQRVVCVDNSPNRLCASLDRLRGVKLLTRGKIYVIRAIDEKPGWNAPGWGVHLDGVWIAHPNGGAWAIHPQRFRPVVDRPTNIDVFRKLLAPPKKPTRPVQLQLPLKK